VVVVVVVDTFHQSVVSFLEATPPLFLLQLCPLIRTTLLRSVLAGRHPTEIHQYLRTIQTLSTFFPKVAVEDSLPLEEVAEVGDGTTS
jgi:hypothetical protein